MEWKPMPSFRCWFLDRSSLINWRTGEHMKDTNGAIYNQKWHKTGRISFSNGNAWIRSPKLKLYCGRHGLRVIFVCTKWNSHRTKLGRSTHENRMKCLRCSVVPMFIVFVWHWTHSVSATYKTSESARWGYVNIWWQLIFTLFDFESTWGRHICLQTWERVDNADSQQWHWLYRIFWSRVRETLKRMWSILPNRKCTSFFHVGTPGVGKSRICAEIAKRCSLKWQDVSKIAKENDLVESQDTELDCPVLDEDKVSSPPRRKIVHCPG